MSRSIRVYYVTALQSAKPSDLKDTKRHDLAKFFDRSVAESHCANMHPTWALPEVEERIELDEDQHEAHRS